MNINAKKDYKCPLIEYGDIIPAIICDSLVDGGSEFITEEEWEF